MKLSKKQVQSLYYWVAMGRRLEERVSVLIKEGRLRGHHHPAVGQEATNAAVAFAMKDEDYITLSHRGKTPELIRGVSLKELMAGYFGRKGGLSGGRAPTGSHMYGDMEKHVVPMPGVIGSAIVLATGVGMGLKYRKTRGVSVVLFGDGGSNRGDFHEGINMAAALKLPVVYLLVNNSYSMSVAVRAATGRDTLSARAAGYGIPGVTVDGNDVGAVYDAVESALDHARSGNGPSLVECMVHRWTGHSITDADVYRSDDERRAGEALDPVRRFRDRLMADGTVPEKTLDQLEAQVDADIDEAVTYAESCSDPDPADILRGVYVAEA